jgi:hypothetical protein
MIDEAYLETALASPGLPLPSSREKRIALNYLVTEAVIAAANGRSLSYSRRTNWYTGLSFYFGRPFTYASIVPCVDALVNAGLCRHYAGYWRSNGSGFQSALQAIPALVADLLDAPVQYCPVARPIWLRRRKEKDLIAYKSCAPAPASTHAREFSCVASIELWMFHLKLLDRQYWVWRRRCQLRLGSSPLTAGRHCALAATDPRPRPDEMAVS